MTRMRIGRALLLEALDDAPAAHVGQAAVQDRDGWSAQLEVAAEVVGEPVQGRDALGEDDGAHGMALADADVVSC